VHHKDANKLNNVPNNLQWVTKSEHVELTDEQGLFWYPKGEKHQNAKFTQIEANKIRVLYATNKYTQKQLAEMYLVNPMTILRILNNQTYINEGA
jgi:HNH endonuclease